MSEPSYMCLLCFVLHLWIRRTGRNRCKNGWVGTGQSAASLSREKRPAQLFLRAPRVNVIKNFNLIQKKLLLLSCQFLHCVSFDSVFNSKLMHIYLMSPSLHFCAPIGTPPIILKNLSTIWKFENTKVLPGYYHNYWQKRVFMFVDGAERQATNPHFNHLKIWMLVSSGYLF